jgi:hypothetical protein
LSVLQNTQKQYQQKHQQFTIATSIVRFVVADNHTGRHASLFAHALRLAHIRINIKVLLECSFPTIGAACTVLEILQTAILN